MCRAPSTRGRGSYGTRSGPPGAATLSCKLGAPYLNLTSASRLDVTGVSPRVGRHQVAQGSLAVLADDRRSEEHTSELQSLMRISYAVFCLKKKTIQYLNPY